MTRTELVSSREYWITKIQLDLFNQIELYMNQNQLSRTQLADKMGVTKGYVSQILNGDFDHKISKLVDLALAVGKVPAIDYLELTEFTEREEIDSPTTPVFTGIVWGGETQSFHYLEGKQERINLKPLIA